MKTRPAVLLALVALAGAAAALALRGRPLARPVPVSELWLRREAWQGRDVTASGTLKSFSDQGAPYYVIEQDGYRVGVSGVSDELAKPLLGTRVTVTGAFGFSEKGGGFVQARALFPLEPKS